MSLVTMELDTLASVIDENVTQSIARETKELRDELAIIKMLVHELQEKAGLAASKQVVRVPSLRRVV